jgi:pimeloyl-ACP methyl ester carboxylesterase
MWVSRHPLNNSLAVFIHGIWGSRWATWKSHVDFFQGIYNRRPELISYDIYFFHYQTAWIHQPPLHPDVTGQLRAFLDREGQRYDTIILVCHSQGGLVGKRYILEELLAGRGETMKIDLVLTLNTPHRGARFWVHPVLYSAKFINQVSRIRNGRLLRQLAELTSFSVNVRFLKKNWNREHILTAPGKATAHCRYIRSISLGSRNDLFVSMKSAKGFEVDIPNSGLGSHSVDSRVIAEYVGLCLSRHENPITLNRQLDQIYGDPNRLTTHKAQCVKGAGKLIQQQNASVSAQYVDCKAISLSEDFRGAFARHPLRKLDLRQAFETYVQKLLND